MRQKPFMDALWVGMVLWVIAAAVWPTEFVTLILLLAALVIVPLTLRLIRDHADAQFPRALMRPVITWQLPAAAALVVAHVLPRGTWAALLAVPWLLLAAVAAAAGLVHVARRWSGGGGVLRADQLGLDAGLVFFFVGGAWVAIYRSGAEVMHFSDVIVQLTGVHFHYAGFVLSVIAGRLAGVYPQRMVRHAVTVIVVSMMLVAAGMTWSPALEIAGVCGLTAAGSVVAAFQWHVAHRAAQRGVKAALSISSLSLIFGLVCAVGYALPPFTGRVLLDIPTMIPLHGLAMAVGFALLGVIGWRGYVPPLPR